MPLHDHFHPPLSERRKWSSFYSGWIEMIADDLNDNLLPERYYAETNVHLGRLVEVNKGTFENHPSPRGQPIGNGGVATWTVTAPTATTPIEFDLPDLFEILIARNDGGPHLVAAIELVSPSTKDQSAQREMFAIKCASYFQQGVSVCVVDIVTQRTANLHHEILELLDLTVDTPAQQNNEIYAVSYRPVFEEQSKRLELWVEELHLGTELPIIPLWLHESLYLPLRLEETYQRACVSKRIETNP